MPPLTVKSILPVAFPKHNTFTFVVAKVSGFCGCVIVTLVVAVQPLASVTNTLYVPATRFCGSCNVEVFDQEYVYGAVPPAGVKLMLPVLFPKHNTLTWVVDKESGAWGSVIVALIVAVQLLASVTVTLYVPATKLLMSCVVAPLLQTYVYNGVPPVGVKLILPVLFPKHSTFT